MKTLNKLLFFAACIFASLGAFAQGGTDYKPITLKINEDGSKYIRFINWAQFWMSYDDAGADINNNKTEFRLRRARFLAYAQVNPKFLILTHIGINNQSFRSGGLPTTATGSLGGGANGAAKKPQVFFHDIWTEYQVVKDYLYLGTGLHYWNGVSRLSNASTLNFLTLDAPIFNWYIIEQSDQFARQLGIYAKGKIGRLDYRLALNQPFQFNAQVPLADVASNTSTFVQNSNWSTQGYINWQFLDKESNKLPYFVGTYLGTKKVFNLGFGWHHHPDAVAYVPEGEVLPQREDILLFGVDATLDMPFNEGEGGALTAYAVYYNYDYGNNYTRGTLLGTGSIFYAQAGYMFKKFDNNAKLQPYVAFDTKSLDGLNDNVNEYKFGVNYFIEGHHAKVTLEYSNAPRFIGPDIANEDSRLGIFRLQTHIFL